ncbi:6-hydroxymethylpterin diphosphokinase MptE-like protein [Algibacillus agarilyticus]|uniref:6-hydroxymethylpterin diphosphokinase MptE-like protein n=1 Tax=Algibacillus agarilyticus TaxID=2234133 RepID=UPI000DCFA950|nr:6-hydroxymethylpterin diphosphokinase MptE-like protein [Algibacillus agarilyticus]
MLKDIRMHLEKDEDAQTEIENQSSLYIKQNHKKNVSAFARHIPSLVGDIQDTNTQNIAFFLNQNSQFNIVDYGAGRAFYGLDPDREVKKQFDVFTQHAPYVDINRSISESTDQNLESGESLDPLTSLASYQKYQTYKALPTEVNLLIVFGIGLAKHLLLLVEQHKINHLVIYEPERQYFQCSAAVAQWQDILDIADKKGTSIYFQLEKDGRDLISDIEELKAHFSINEFYFYKHYNHPIFDAIELDLKNKPWSRIIKDGFSYQYANYIQSLPHWTQSISVEDYSSVDPNNDDVFQKNLTAFKYYFPDIHEEFKNYQPKNWLPIKAADGEINIIQKETLIAYYGNSPKKESILNYEHFSQYPNKDGLVLGYTGTKLKQYLHYQLVASTEKLLKEVEEDVGDLPETLKSLIIFGVGLGYQIEHLLSEKKVEKLFLCEPNRDFFYASLFATDWAGILEKVDKAEGRLYINVGDDGSNLFRDLLRQFYAVGPYILANTYFYQCYYNSELVKAVAQLREQLQIVISMGEYYDHARYGIAHTTETINRHYPFLAKNPEKLISFNEKNVPIFLVGNGPSLDSLIEVIKEWRDQAIVVSCGTALMPLYKNGITPDYHAEIELNRSTYDWCCRVGDFEYLKNITLLSCNGIHPDTCDLFKDVLIAFKDGESSTVSALEILGADNFEELQYAFPTVSNFAINLFTKIGFNQIYLMGVDLGFVDNKNHHSKQSGYYQENGKEMFDYAAKNNTSIVIPGNFRPTVFTKQEFKVSKAIIEETLASQKVDCFNCSDGARVIGSIPLKGDLILLTNSHTDKTNALRSLRHNVFKDADPEQNYQDRFNAKFQAEVLKNELTVFIEKSQQSITCIEDVERLIEEQKTLLFTSYQHGKSLLFYLLYGTVNYINATFTKCLNTPDHLNLCQQVLEEWLSTLQTIKGDFIDDPKAFDFCSSLTSQRETVLLRKAAAKLTASIYTEDQHNSFTYFECMVNSIFSFGEEDNPDTATECGKVWLDLIDYKCSYSLLHDSNNLIRLNVPLQSFQYLDEQLNNEPHLSYFFWLGNLDGNKESLFNGEHPLVHIRRCTFLPKFLLNSHKVKLFLPKYQFCNSTLPQKKLYLSCLIKSLSNVKGYVEYTDYIAIPKDSFSLEDIECDVVGNRGRIRRHSVTLESLLWNDFSEIQAINVLDAIQYGKSWVTPQ